MNVSLREITEKNWYEATKLKVAKSQKGTVAENVYSIAESKFYPTYEIRGIYADGKMVGFAFYGFDTDENENWIARVMVDENYQRKGYGEEGVKLILERFKERNEGNYVKLSFVEGNKTAEKLYEKIGFAKTGEVIDGEEVMKYEF
ncbi:MAG: GNAT family N-acetyltransferase [Calditrichaeota bacterium]|nr:MAG: GNAT family N-acetyltransferase [Calditrichota bacterium]